MRIITFLLSILIIFLGVTFAILNAAPVNINYYIATSQMPLSLLLVLTLGVGLVLGLIVGMMKVIGLKAANVSLKGRVKLAEKEVANLRAIPLKNEH